MIRDESYFNFNSPGTAAYSNSNNYNSGNSNKYRKTNDYNIENNKNIYCNNKENNSFFNHNFNSIIFDNETTMYQMNHDINVMPVSVTQGPLSQGVGLTLSQTLDMKGSAPEVTLTHDDHHHINSNNKDNEDVDVHSLCAHSLCTLSRSQSTINLLPIQPPPFPSSLSLPQSVTSSPALSQMSLSTTPATSTGGTPAKNRFPYVFGRNSYDNDTNEIHNDHVIVNTSVDSTSSACVDIQFDDNYNDYKYMNYDLQTMQSSTSPDIRSKQLLLHARREAEEEEDLMYNRNENGNRNSQDNLSTINITHGRINLLTDMNNELNENDNSKNRIHHDIVIEQQHNNDDYGNKNPFSISMPSTLSSSPDIINNTIVTVPVVITHQAYEVRKRPRDEPAFFETEEQ